MMTKNEANTTTQPKSDAKKQPVLLKGTKKQQTPDVCRPGMTA